MARETGRIGAKFARRRAHDGQVDLLARQHVDNLDPVADLQLEAHVGPLERERHQQRWQQVFGGGHRADAQRAAADAVERGQFVAGLLPQMQYALGKGGHHLAGRRQLDAAPHLARERSTGDLLEGAQLQRDRRLGHVQRLGRLRNAFQPRHEHKRLELAEAGVIHKVFLINY